MALKSRQVHNPNTSSSHSSRSVEMSLDQNSPTGSSTTYDWDGKTEFAESEADAAENVCFLDSSILDCRKTDSSVI